MGSLTFSLLVTMGLSTNQLGIYLFAGYPRLAMVYVHPPSDTTLLVAHP